MESIHGDFLNVVGFPLNRFCKKLAELYGPLHPEDRLRIKHDAFPTMDTSDNLSDVDDEGSRHRGAQGVSDRFQAQGGKDTKIADRKPTVESLPLTGLLQLKDGFKASKVPC